jgi:hypothetical protein
MNHYRRIDQSESTYPLTHIFLAIQYRSWNNDKIQILDQWYNTDPGTMVQYRSWNNGTIQILEQ